MPAEIKKYNFKPGLPQEFEILDMAKLLASAKATLTTAHRAGFYHILWFQKGSPTHWVDFSPIKIKSNSLLFLNKDVVQRFDSKVRFEGKVILFTDGFFSKSEQDIKFLRSSSLFHDLHPTAPIGIAKQTKPFEELLQLMQWELQANNGVNQSEFLQNLLHNFLILAEREKRKQNIIEFKQGTDLDSVIIFKDLLDLNFKKQKHVSFYAAEIMTTEKRLNQATYKVLGKTPKAIIDERVLLEAKRILAHTNESIKEIGYELGFEEPTNFIKYFKKHTSITPLEFRAKNRVE